ncbi:MAG: succinylglutamate desuccinylase/aspartoacylase family protein [Rhodoferax sp.]|nr:succinylglutamate desuccinylase/aspartoacylase family protein [Rhodoferax sp.]
MPDTVPTTALRLHSFRALHPGPRLIVTGAVHGNETCGSKAIQRVAAELDSGVLQLLRGSLTLVPVTNPLAYERGQRMGDRNLNRNLYPNAMPQDYEDHIANVLCPLLAAHDVLLDLHSFHSPGEPFVMLGPQDNTGELEPFAHAAQEEALALRLGPRRIVEGWLQTYAEGVKVRLARTQGADRAQLLSTDPRYGVGTTEYMRSQGGYGVTLECGQHDDPQAPEVGWRAIRHTLALLQMVDAPAPTPTAEPQMLRLTQVIDKHHAEDRFTQPWSSYDPVTKGQTIGVRHDGTPVQADADGFIVFPNPGALAGNEWFYFAQRSSRLAPV